MGAPGSEEGLSSHLCRGPASISGAEGWQGEVSGDRLDWRLEALTPSPSPGARERGVLPGRVGPHPASSRQSAAHRQPDGSPLPRTGRGVGGEGSWRPTRATPNTSPCQALQEERKPGHSWCISLHPVVASVSRCRSALRHPGALPGSSDDVSVREQMAAHLHHRWQPVENTQFLPDFPPLEPPFQAVDHPGGRHRPPD